MKGAEALLRTLIAGGIDVCFTNPGTSEMQFVAALDRVPEMRAILTLFEGVATGAADGYARMTGKPASTLLHLGPGLANGLANFHNAMRARSAIVNIVGDHATTHQQYEAPLTSDVAGYARQVSGWVRSNAHPLTIANDTADAIRAARQAPGQIATLIAPADCTWLDSPGPAAVLPPAAPAIVDQAIIEQIANVIQLGQSTLLLMTGAALLEGPLYDAGRIAAHTNAKIASIPLFPRMSRGAGRVAISRLPYAIDQALAFLKDFQQIILVGADPPVSFFAYPNRPSWLTPETAQLHTLARPDHDLSDALRRLADQLGAPANIPTQVYTPMEAPTGPLTPQTIAQAVSAFMPEGCIVAEEAITAGFAIWPYTIGAPAHEWLMTTGGAIGCGMPLATGAAVACPDQRVLNLQADGSAAYTLQSLWTQARERLNVTTILLSNRSYRILEIEYQQTGAGTKPGPRSQQMMSLDNPEIQWVQLAQGMGVPASRVTTADELSSALQKALATTGPVLIEAMVD